MAEPIRFIYITHTFLAVTEVIIVAVSFCMCIGTYTMFGFNYISRLTAQTRNMIYVYYVYSLFKQYF